MADAYWRDTRNPRSVRSNVVPETEKEVNEWQTIAWVIGVGGSIFGGMWLLLQDFKRGSHKRIDRLENVVDEISRGTITTKAFDRFESNMTVRLEGMTTQMATTNSRIDDLILAVRNGGVQKK